MADFTLRSDQIDVEQIMRQIRARIKEKRGADYTEEEIRELASVKLERFLDPRALRADLLQHYRRQHAPRPLPPLPPPPENYGFEDHTIYESHRGPLRWIRRLLNPLLKLFFNPNPLIHVLNVQSKANEQHWQALSAHADHVNQRFMARDELDGLNYEVITNLVLELTRLGIETRNLKMRVESLSTRLDFDERRARALEGVVQYRPGALSSPAPEPAGGDEAETAESGPEADAAGRPGKRRRRRRGRRRGAAEEGGGAAGTAEGTGHDEGQEGTRSADASPTAAPDRSHSPSDGGTPDPQ